MKTMMPKMQTLHPTQIDLPLTERERLVTLLNQTLAASFDLMSQTKQAHWNVKGPHFLQLHELFDTLAEELEAETDMIAERITTLGGTAMGTVRMAASNSILPEYSAEITQGDAHLQALIERTAQYGRTVREAIQQTADWGDLGTSDMYTELSRAVDKRLWFLESHVQR